MSQSERTEDDMRQRLVKMLGSLFAVFVFTFAYAAYTHQLPTLSNVQADVLKNAVETVSSTAARVEPAVTSSTKVMNAFVVRAVDGDTLVVKLDGESGEQKIRLLGINTPETVDPRRPVQCFGKEASKRMHGLVDGKRVRLEADPQADERDKYNRLLRNVFLEDGTDVNASMVRDGYAYAYLSFPLNPFRKRELKNMQEDAKLAGRGLWNPDTCNGNP